MRISEATTALKIPVVVEGAHEGTVKVHIQYVEANGLKDDENVIITSRDLLIPAGVSEVQLETRLSVANDEVENGRALTFEIVSVEGANLGSNSTCTVNLRESTPIEGTYAVTGINPFDGVVGGGLTCTLLLSETNPNQLELNFGYGATIPVTMEPGDAEGDYNLYIAGGNNAGNYQGYDLTFCYAILQGQNLNYNSTQDMAAYFENATQTITILPTQAYVGVGICAFEAGWLDAFLAYPDSNTGEIVPVQMVKQ